MKQHRIELLIILGSLSAFAPLATDMYLPALPEVGRALHADSSAVQDTVATFFLGFAAGQLFYGPITDRFGRKLPLYFGVGLFTIASALCAGMPSIEAMIALRFVEALGACAGTVVSRAMVRDLFPPEESARIFSTLMLVMVLAPILAPLIGGYLLLWLGWRSIFWALAGAGAASLASIILRLPESHPADPSRSLAIGNILGVYANLLGQRRFLLTALSGAFAFGGLFGYIAGSPFVFIEWYGLPPQHYSWLFATNAAAIMIASQLNHRLIHRLGSARMLHLAGYVQCGAGAAMLIAALTGWGGIVAFAVPLWFYVGCIGIVAPNATALAMAEEGHHIGAASALIGALQFGIGTVSALSIGAFHAVTPTPIAVIIALCGVMTPLLVALTSRRRS